MSSRKVTALLAAIVMIAFGAADLFGARTVACGPHPCCAKGACKMMKGGGTSFDRCLDNAQKAPQPSGVLTAAVPLPLPVTMTPLLEAPAACGDDGAAPINEPPPRA